jgi:hypothetical protein
MSIKILQPQEREEEERKDNRAYVSSRATTADIAAQAQLTRSVLTDATHMLVMQLPLGAHAGMPGLLRAHMDNNPIRARLPDRSRLVLTWRLMTGSPLLLVFCATSELHPDLVAQMTWARLNDIHRIAAGVQCTLTRILGYNL